MSVIYSQPVINSRLQDVANAIDAGPTAGVLRLLSSAGNVLSTCIMSKPCGTVGGGILTFNTASFLDSAATGVGPAVSARCEDSNGTVVISGLTVGTVAGDIILSPTNVIAAGQVVAITAATITGN